jgi:hypothetical protein
MSAPSIEELIQATKIIEQIFTLKPEAAIEYVKTVANWPAKKEGMRKLALDENSPAELRTTIIKILAIVDSQQNN